MKEVSTELHAVEQELRRSLGVDGEAQPLQYRESDVTSHAEGLDQPCGIAPVAVVGPAGIVGA